MGMHVCARLHVHACLCMSEYMHEHTHVRACVGVHVCAGQRSILSVILRHHHRIFWDRVPHGDLGLADWLGARLVGKRAPDPLSPPPPGSQHTCNIAELEFRPSGCTANSLLAQSYPQPLIKSTEGLNCLELKAYVFQSLVKKKKINHLSANGIPIDIKLLY